MAIVSFAFVPIYINYLGMEAYGLVGFFSTMLLWLHLIDAGLAPTLSREFAHYTAGQKSLQATRDLLRSGEIIGCIIALCTFILLFQGSNWLAHNWLNLEALSHSEVINALIIMAGIASLRYIEGIYRCCLIGLQRQVILNVATGSLAIIRALGAILVLEFVSPTISSFFVWQVIISFFTSVIYAGMTYNFLPKSQRRGMFSIYEVKKVSKFAAGVIGTTLVALIFVQSDKLILSKYLTLSEYGNYMIASLVSGLIFVTVAPISQAIYPKLCGLFSSDNKLEISRMYHFGAQSMTIVAGTAAIMLIVFSTPLVFTWTGDKQITTDVANLVSILAVGNLFNALNNMPLHTQLANGWSSLAMKLNFFVIIFYIPALLMVVFEYGAIGAASLWAITNLFYLPASFELMARRILAQERLKWYVQDTLLPLACGLIMAFFCRSLFHFGENVLLNLIFLFLTSALVFAATLMGAGQLRGYIFNYLKLNGYTKIRFNR